MSRHRAVRNLDLDGKKSMEILWLNLDYLDDEDDEVDDTFGEEPIGLSPSGND
jgi:hypothetical protein